MIQRKDIIKPLERGGVFVEMMTIPRTVPKGMVPYLNDMNQDHFFERNAMILYPFIQNLTIFHGGAAEILGVHKFDLIDFLVCRI